MKLSELSAVPPTPRTDPLQDVRSIAVLRANAVGDFIITLPALQALRERFPAARIVLLGKHWHADFLRDRAGPVDEVMILPDVPGLTVAPESVADEASISHWCEQACRQHFDLAIQLHGGGRYSNPFVKRLGAAMTAGFVAPGSEPLDRSLSYQVLQPQLTSLLECVSLVGARCGDYEPHLSLRAQDEIEAAAVLPPSAQPLVVLQPGASDPRKCWSPARFAAVADHFVARGAQIAINGTESEGAAVRAVIAHMRHAEHAHDLTGKLSVGGLAGLIARARLVVSNDTGPVHLARALGVPNVTIIWAANLVTYGPLSSALNRVAVSWRLDCPVCGGHSIGVHCGHTDSFVDDVGIEEVIAQAEELFEPVSWLTAQRLRSLT